MQVLHPLLSCGGEKLLTDQQPELGHFGSDQRHDEQRGEDGSQRKDGVGEQQLGFGKALLLKQGHRVGKVFLVIFLTNRNSD